MHQALSFSVLLLALGATTLDAQSADPASASAPAAVLPVAVADPAASAAPEATPPWPARPIADADQLAEVLRERGQIPPAPEGVHDLAFSRIYRTPLGPKGLELEPATAALTGQRVRILGFMVRQARPSPGVALLAPFPLTTNEVEYSLSDDLPVSTLFVDVPAYADIAVPHTPGPLLLTGRFETGPRQEADGRISHLRLVLDEEAGLAPAGPAVAATQAAREVASTAP